MDSPDHSPLQENEATLSSDEEYVLVEDMAVVFPRSRFLATYRRHQNFAFPPDSIIYYITKNPSSTKAYQKLIQSCKHFFIQNPILVVSRFACKYHNRAEFYVNFNYKHVEEFKNMAGKIWVTDTLINENVHSYLDVQDHFSTSIIPKIYQCDVKKLIFECQIITFNDFLLLASKCTIIVLTRVTVKDEDNAVVALEKLFKVMPQIKEFICWLPPDPTDIITSKTAQGVVKIPNFSICKDFRLYGFPEAFDIHNFYEYIKKNTSILFDFNDHISEHYKAHLQKIVDEIIQAENHDFKVPTFPGIDPDSEIKLHRLS